MTTLNKLFKSTVFLSCLLLCNIAVFAQKEMIFFNQNWKFSCNDSNVYRNASIPGSVFTDLMSNNIIENPFIKDNEKKIDWVANQKWTYINIFDVDVKKISKYSNIEIWFEGLDTYTSIYLNDSLIIESNNAFHPWFADVKLLLKPKENILKIVFQPLKQILEVAAEKYPFKLPEGNRLYARKPQFHFGWDFAPSILNISISKPVSLRFWNGFSFEDVSCDAKPENNNGILGSLFFIRTNKDTFMKFSLQIKDIKSGKIWYDDKVKTSITNLRSIEVKIADIKIWSVNNPNYYDVLFTISHSKYGNQSIQKRIGFRDILLKRTADSVGTQFFIELNGNSVFCKGANWVPAEVFQHKNSIEKYRKLLILAKDAGYNMIRVWGGGYYEDNSFYELCDSLGIMVWQDFMFACSMYPFNEEFISSVKTEADFQLRRMSSHPSIALWCGNNENTEGWFNWGWQKQLGYSKADSADIWNGNYNLFYVKLPEWCSFYNLPNNYVPSSPLLGWGRDAAYKSGDIHYWGVWWGNEPFEKYTEKVGRFVSEYGFQSFPVKSTVEYMMQGSLDSLKHPYIAQHQKHARGHQTIEEYMKRDFFIPDSIDDYLYLSELLQSEGVAKAILAHRLAMPYCMGTLFWQFNDCWPAISWSAVDYFNQPKAFYYQTKRLFKEFAPIIIHRNDSVLFYVSNLSNNTWNGKVIIGSFNADSKKLKYDTIILSSEAMHNKVIISYKPDNFKIMVYGMQMMDNTGLICGHFTLFGKNDIAYRFLNPQIKTDVVLGCNNPEFSFCYRVSSNVPVFGYKNENQNGAFTDNSFHLFPGFVYEFSEMKINTSITKYSNIKFKCLNNLKSEK